MTGKATKWIQTGRKVKRPDGSVRTVYTSAAKPGEERIRRTVMRMRKGESTASYVYVKFSAERTNPGPRSKEGIANYVWCHAKDRRDGRLCRYTDS